METAHRYRSRRHDNPRTTTADEETKQTNADHPPSKPFIPAASHYRSAHCVNTVWKEEKLDGLSSDNSAFRNNVRERNLDSARSRRAQTTRKRRSPDEAVESTRPRSVTFESIRREGLFENARRCFERSGRDMKRIMSAEKCFEAWKRHLIF